MTATCDNSGYLYKAIGEYYALRGLKWPDTDEALMWVITEYAEVMELMLAKKGGWVRNNPDDHQGYSREAFAEELGDVIFMLIVAGMVEGVDPIGAMFDKMASKIGKMATPKSAK